MVKKVVGVIIIFDTKYGNTKLVAEKIAEGINEVAGFETAIRDVQKIDLNEISNYDAILIGSPNHIGGPVRGIKKLIDKLGKLNLKAKRVAFFDTQLGGNQFEKAVKKMEKRKNEKASGLELITPGLSIKVKGMKGPIAEEGLQKCIDFGKNIANLLKT
jgi:flavodoxin